MKRFDLCGKVAVVTGGNGGIGAGLACGLLECGATVVIAGRNKAKCEAAVADLGTIGPPVSSFVMDVTVEAECKAVVAETVKRYGRVDVLVTNAGGGANTGVPPSPPDEIAVEGFRKIIDANLTSTFMLSQAAYREMKRAGVARSSTSARWRLTLGARCGLPTDRPSPASFSSVRTARRPGQRTISKSIPSCRATSTLT